MAAEDELALPEIPEAKASDPEDVSWALSTAEAMWARGDHLEGIKWVRKAAEAASEVEDDERALELAKAASELTSLIARRSRASIGEGPGYAGGAPPSFSPSTERSGSGAPPAPPAPAASRPPPVLAAKSAPPPLARSAPPIPLPSRASAPPRPSNAPQVSQGPQASQAPQAPQVPQAARSAPRPLATGEARQGPQAGRGILSNRTAPKARRRSRENLEGEARAAGVIETAPHAVVDTPTEGIAFGDLGEVTSVGTIEEKPVAHARVKRKSRPEPDPTVITTLKDLVRAEREKSAAEWDASPTQNLTGEEMAEHMSDGDRKTAFVMPASAPVSVAPPPTRAPVSTVHDPEIQTSQAVRVVVWRDGGGVHIAPAGTVVSSITIDAVLVVLEPSADLTAWLSQRER